MFECSACTLRCLRALAGESITASPRSRLLLTPRLTLSTQRRRKASTAVTTTNTTPSSSSNAGNEPYLNAAQLRHQALQQQKSTHPLDVAAAEEEPTFDSSKSELAIDTATKRALQKELQFLPDPAKLADHILYTLRCEKRDKAIMLARMASKEGSCVVAWNHIVNWHMQKGRVNEALKLFNEMKKRQQFPDAYTYSLLLRGLVGKPQDGKAPEVSAENAVKAISIYNSMTSPTSRVQPSIIHTNTVLKICTFAHDMDGFWGIAARIPDHGPGAADHITYSTILAAIRHDALAQNRTTLEGEDWGARMVEHRRRAVEEGKKVWREVVQKWRAGQVRVDEQLVCAMGRLLLVSDRLADWDEVLSLAQQTMRIERLVEAVGSEGRRVGHVPGQGRHMERDVDVEHEGEDGEDGGADHATKDMPATKTFNPVQPFPADPAKPKRPTALAYVAPGNATLNLLLETCTLMHAPKVSTAYWEHLTKTLGVTPDLANFHARLRHLAKNRASARAARLLKEDMSAAGVKPEAETFRLAMSVCQRDIKNRGVVANATAIIDVMESVLSDLDTPTLHLYLALALSQKGESADAGQGALATQVVAVLNRLESVVENLRSRVLYGTDERMLTKEGHRRDKVDAVGFLSKMVGTMDTLMNRGLVPRADFQSWHARRSRLSRFIDRASDKDSETKVVRKGWGMMGRLRDASGVPGEDGGVLSRTPLGLTEESRALAKRVEAQHARWAGKERGKAARALRVFRQGGKEGGGGGDGGGKRESRENREDWAWGFSDGGRFGKVRGRGEGDGGRRGRERGAGRGGGGVSGFADSSAEIGL